MRAFAFTMAILAVAVLVAPTAEASPIWFEVQTGAQLFKYNDRALDDGIPRFSDWTWDFYAGLEWSPAPRTGLYLAGGFRYQALGRSEFSEQTFFDGPRLALKWRGTISP